MKKILRSVTACLLAAILCAGMIPVSAIAEETANDTVSPTSDVDIGDVNIEGTNSFGAMLAEDITDSGEMSETVNEYEAGYGITAVEITDGVATVAYDSLETANLVVSIYSEDGTQMITSGKTEVTADETTATVTIDGDMPAYFTAEAFLLDTYDFSPLCESYSTPLYTQEMQELLASTTADYDAELVLNLDEDETTNFAVYHENIKQIPCLEGANILVSADSETRTYVFENVNEQITSLQSGDIFAYGYGEEDLLIVKVDTISVGDTTAVITGVDTEMSEVFAAVKIEGYSDTEDMVVDTSTADEGVIYRGLEENEVQTFAFEGNVGATAAHVFDFDGESKVTENGVQTVSKVSGTVKFEVPVTIKYYISTATQYVEFKAEPTVKAEVSVSGKIEKSISLGCLPVSPCPGIYVKFEPKLVLGFDCDATFTAKISMTFGVKADSTSGVKNLTSAPIVDVDLSVEGKVTFGVDWVPSISIFHENVVSASLTTFTGLELTAKGEGNLYETKNAQTIHLCKECLSVDIVFRAEITGEVRFSEWLTMPVTIGKFTIPLDVMYYSFDKSEFGIGECPYKAYRVTVQPKDANGNALSNIKVAVSNKTATTNFLGTAAFYLPKGTYVFIADDGMEVWSKTVHIGEAQKVVLSKSPRPSSSLDNSDMHMTIDNGPVVASGSCGANAYWKLYRSGLLHIVGSGEMYGWGSDTMPWKLYRETINSVIIESGITSIGDTAFYKCISLKNVTIPNSVSTIGYRALSECISLTSIIIPDSVTSIAGGVFWGCSSLTNVTISNNVTSIGERVFIDCTSLTSISIPSGVTSIGYGAFYRCTSLTSITIPNGVTAIGSNAFSNCTSLTSITIPNGVTAIGSNAFSDCTSLTSITVPSSVTVIGEGVFYHCTSLTSVIIPSSFTSVRKYTFSNCTSLTSITIPNTIISIEMFAFDGCTALSDVYYTGTQSQWNAITIDFSNTPLTSATIHYNSTMPTALSYGTVDVPAYNAVIGGTYETVTSEDGSATYKTASFEGLVPQKAYTLLVLASTEVEDALTASNLLYIKQGAAAEDGTLQFTYIPREDIVPCYVMVCGASENDLSGAQITFPTMASNEACRTVTPTVVYDGATLTEGVDYVVVGTVDYTEAGEYTCTIRGICDYTGTVACSYTVYVAGDITADALVTTDDARLALQKILGFSEAFSAHETVIADMNGDTRIDSSDVRCMLQAIVTE